jgi:ABC-type multidrug transport system permease subunit
MFVDGILIWTYYYKGKFKPVYILGTGISKGEGWIFWISEITGVDWGASLKVGYRSRWHNAKISVCCAL